MVGTPELEFLILMIGLAPFQQRVTLHAFNRHTLPEVLGLQAPPFSDHNQVFKQMRYVADYVAEQELGCDSLIIEAKYVDRDHMEDHSVFYSRNFYPYPNHCKRIHFFRRSPRYIWRELQRLVRIGHQREREWWINECKAFSAENYLGYSVIKPLNGCPVGRTVLRTFPATGRNYIRDYTCTRVYEAHLLGLRLEVNGLPFQQQDKAVAACATTAIWSSLHMVRENEDIAAVSPAQITKRASQNSLPFGRPMPSEGLSIDQMCQAIYSAGVSPVLHIARDFESTRGLLYSAIRSKVSPILVLRKGEDWHAVAVVGMKCYATSPIPIKGGWDRACALRALYIHDDRFGPYLRADISKQEDNGEFPLVLFLSFGPEKNIPPQSWQLTHLLFPMHAKIRMSFATLRLLAKDLARRLEAIWAVWFTEKRGTTQFEAHIQRSDRYIQELLERRHVGHEAVIGLTTTVSMPRYVGVIRLSESEIGTMDVLVDTTATDRNPHPIAIVSHADGRGSLLHVNVAEIIAHDLGCEIVWGSIKM